MAIFRETKPRKAKYGFQAPINHSTIIEIGPMVKTITVTQGHEWFYDMTNSFGRAEFLIYFNDDDLYNEFKALNDAS